MLKVSTRTTLQSTEESTLPQIVFKPDTPNRLKAVLKDLYYPVPRFFNAKILKSEYCTQILQYVSSWPSLDSFYLNTVKSYGNSTAPLLKQLTVISFLNLQQLYLENIKLDNFEFIQFIQCPNLKIIYLMKNDAKVLKSLTKTNWKKLQKIEINDEFGFLELQCLQRMKMSPNGRVINPITNDDMKTNKKKDITNIDDSLMSIWPKLQGKVYAHLVEERISSIRKRS